MREVRRKEDRDADERAQHKVPPGTPARVHDAGTETADEVRVRPMQAVPKANEARNAET